jgi:glycosyltransferase involved in cell wall biosynthesis
VQAVCLVVPCYNEQHRLDVAAFERFMHEQPQVSFCFANDRSEDDTIGVLRGLHARHPERTLIVDLPVRSGKAEAVRQAMLEALAWQPFDYIGYWDADLAAPLEASAAMWRLAESRPGCLLVMGSRVRRLGAAIDRRKPRHYLGRVFATMASLILKLPIYDTQCGAKLVHASLVADIFRQPFASRWFFDVEMLARVRNRVGVERLLAHSVELPLDRWRDIHGSKLKLADIMRAPLDLWRIHRRYNVL